VTNSRLFDQDTPDDQVDPPARPVADATVVEPAPRQVAQPYPYADTDPVPDADDEPFLDQRQYVKVGRPAGPIRKIFAVVLGVLLVVGTVAGAATLWLQRQINPPGGPGDPVAFTIDAGATVDEVVDELANAEIVSNPTVFRYYLRWRRVDSFQAGDYVLVENSSFDDVIDTLAAGPAPIEMARFTVPEGLTLDEMIDRLDAQIEGFHADEVPSALIRLDTPWRPGHEENWEGLLFPDTYEYEATEDTYTILSRMNNQFDAVARSVGLDPWMGIDPGTLQPTGLTAYDYVIIASMLETEARLPEEHALMSRVIHNRLELGMTLGIDATVIYARGPEREGPITDADLAIDSPYNTRLHPGLPPTPIAAPSRSALEAALNPAEGPWLYYVLADTDGRHFFTDDYNEFLRVRDESRAAGIF
jgi:UPF0755 protein